MRRAGVVVVVLACGVPLTGDRASLGSAAASSASVTRLDRPGALRAGPAFDGGRLWWITGADDARAGATVRLRSRPLSGGRAREVRIRLPAPVPQPGSRESSGVDCTPDALIGISLRVADGDAFVAGSSIAGQAGDVCDAQPFAGRYSTRTGAPLPVAHPTTDGFLLGSAPVAATAAPDGAARLVDWRTGPTASVVPAGAGWAQTAGPYAGWVEGASRFGRRITTGGWATFRVVERATGRTIHAVSAARLARRAGGGAEVRVSEPTLRPDGSLAVSVKRKAAGTGLRPVAVDRAGRVLTPGRRVSGATGAAALVGDGRAFVSVSAGSYGRLPGGRRGFPCSGSWVLDAAGVRGRRLGAQTAGRRSRLGLPQLWDGHVAAWFYAADLDGDQDAVLADRGVRRLRLSRRDLPACPARPGPGPG